MFQLLWNAEKDHKAYDNTVQLVRHCEPAYAQREELSVTSAHQSLRDTYTDRS
jgi:hypothetical protein